MKSAGTICVLLAACAACGAGQPGTAAPTNASESQRSGGGATATDFSARDLDGKTFRLATYLGKNVILLNFWSTWCEPCVAEFPHLRKMYDANKGKGLLIYGIAMDGPETTASIPAFAKRNQINFPVLLDEDSHVAAIYNPKKSAPLSVLIDRRGRIATVREGYNPGDEDYLAKEIAKVLDEPASAQ